MEGDAAEAALKAGAAAGGRRPATRSQPPAQTLPFAMGVGRAADTPAPILPGRWGARAGWDPAGWRRPARPAVTELRIRTNAHLVCVVSYALVPMRTSRAAGAPRLYQCGVRRHAQGW